MSHSGFRCSLCDKTFAEDEVIEIEGHVTCAACKPQLVSGLQEGTGVPGTGVARHKINVVIDKGGRLPPRCIKCNAPADHMLKKHVYWHPPGLYLLILLNVLIYFVVALVVRRKFLFEIGLCDRHHRRRTQAVRLIWGLTGVGLAVLAFLGLGGVAASDPTLFFVVLIVLFLMILCCAGYAHLLSLVKVDSQTYWLRGVCRKYLDSLPDY